MRAQRNVKGGFLSVALCLIRRCCTAPHRVEPILITAWMLLFCCQTFAGACVSATMPCDAYGMARTISTAKCNTSSGAPSFCTRHLFFSRSVPESYFCLRTTTDSSDQVGSLQPIKEIAAACRQRGIMCHTDAAQSIGKVPVKVGCRNTNQNNVACRVCLPGCGRFWSPS